MVGREELLAVDHIIERAKRKAGDSKEATKCLERVGVRAISCHMRQSPFQELISSSFERSDGVTQKKKRPSARTRSQAVVWL